MKTFLISVLLFVVCGGSFAQTKPVKQSQACVNDSKRLHEIEITGGGTIGSGVSSIFLGENWTYQICKDGKWVEDEEANKKREEANEKAAAEYAAVKKHKLDLWNGLLTRVLTDAELMEVLETGYDLVPAKDGGYESPMCMGGCLYSEANEQAKKVAAEKIFQNALLVQFKIRLAAKSTTTDRD